MPEFIDTKLPDGWGEVELRWRTGRVRAWTAKLYVAAFDPNDISANGFLQFVTEGSTPDEAMAYLERAVIETMAQGGQLEERRRQAGRRATDVIEFPAQSGRLGFVQVGRRSTDRWFI